MALLGVRVGDWCFVSLKLRLKNLARRTQVHQIEHQSQRFSHQAQIHPAMYRMGRALVFRILLRHILE